MVGRFPSNDPVGFAEGGVDFFNRYSYTFNDPVNLTDPHGRDPCREWRLATGKYPYTGEPDARSQALGETVAGFLPGAGIVAAIGDVASGNFGSAAFNLATEIPIAKSGKLAKLACFEEGTLVLTQDGKRPIEEIKGGDLVWSANPETGEEGWKTVTQTFVNDDSSVWNLALGDIAAGVSRLHRVTGEHPYWVLNAENGQPAWVPVSELEPGMQIATNNDAVLTVIAATDTGVVKRTYNFEVADFHTYFVGDDEVLVHNMCKVRVTHFTNKSGAKGIQESGVITASDQNSVFTVGAASKEAKGSARDIEQNLGIKRGRESNSVTFDADSSEFSTVKNPRTGATEKVFNGDVDLEGRNAEFK